MGCETKSGKGKATGLALILVLFRIFNYTVENSMPHFVRLRPSTVTNFPVTDYRWYQDHHWGLDYQENRNGRARRRPENAGVYTSYLENWRRNVGRAITVKSRKALDGAWRRWTNWCDIARQEVPVDEYKPSLEVPYGRRKGPHGLAKDYGQCSE